MEKRYQVFVSSTYADLQEERQEVMQALLELDCIPAGMELFPAANEDQWTLIKRVIDDCDYYIVIIAARYGSIGPDGMSFTEMEYRYALESRKPVIGFVHRKPDELPANRCEISTEGREKLGKFRELAQKKMCRFWESPADLGSQVSRSLIKLIGSNPGIGWVRGNLVPDESAAKEILNLRRRIEELEANLEATRTSAPEGTDDLSQKEDAYVVSYSFVSSEHDYVTGGAARYEESAQITWNKIFAAVAPLMINEASDDQIRRALSKLIEENELENLSNSGEFDGLNLLNFRISDNDFHTIKVQLRALGLIQESTKNRSLKDTNNYWKLTLYGDNIMTKLRAIRKTT